MADRRLELDRRADWRAAVIAGVFGGDEVIHRFPLLCEGAGPAEPELTPEQSVAAVKAILQVSTAAREAARTRPDA